MNGLNVLPLTATVNAKETKGFQGDNGLQESTGDGFAALLLNLISNRQQREGQSEDQDLCSSLMGLEGLFLHNPAGKEANSGIIMGQAESALTVLDSLNVDLSSRQWFRLLVQEGLSSGMMQAGSNAGDIPQSELDKYKSEIIKLLQELNGKLDVITKPTGNMAMMQAAAAAKAYYPSWAQFLGDSAESDQNTLLSMQADRLFAQTAAQADNVMNKAAANQTLNQPFGVGANGQASSSSINFPGNGSVLNAIHAQNGLDKGLSSEQNGSSLEGGSGETVNHNHIAQQGLATSENVDFKTVGFNHGEKRSSPSLLQQMVQALQKQTDLLAMSRHSSPQVERVEIQLYPAELGKIYVSLRLEDGQVHLFMQATESSTSSLLQQQLGDLRQTLIDLGVACGHFEMGLGEDRGQQGSEDRPNRGTGSLEYAEAVDEAVSEEQFYAEEDRGSQINLMA